MEIKKVEYQKKVKGKICMILNLMMLTIQKKAYKINKK
jgi:hypothetical protein